MCHEGTTALCNTASNANTQLSLITDHTTLLSHCNLQRMDKHGLIFVNPRFNRKAETLEEAKEQAMFRVLNIIDPLHPEQGTIVQLEHEVRGTSRSSCPLNA